MRAVLGAAIGCTFAVGVLLALRSGSPAPNRRSRGPLVHLIESAHVPRLGVAGLLGACALSAIAIGLAALLLTGLAVMGLIAALAGGGVPVLLLRRRARSRARALRTAWPEAVDVLVSAVRAGMALPEALADLAIRGPGALRPSFAVFAAHYRASGSFSQALDELEADLNDPVADRVVIALRLARDVGGTDLGRVLTALSEFLREDARTRGEIEARYSWTVNAARIAVAAPWVTLVVLATRPETVAAYSTAAGTTVLLACAGLSVVAYRTMMLFGSLPAEQRLVRR